MTVRNALNMMFGSILMSVMNFIVGLLFLAKGPYILGLVFAGTAGLWAWSARDWYQTSVIRREMEEMK